MSSVSVLHTGVIADVRNAEEPRDQAIEPAVGAIIGIDSWWQQKHGYLTHHDLSHRDYSTCTRTLRDHSIKEAIGRS